MHDHHTTTDVLIVGGGIAACLLAWKLHQQAYKVHIIHHPNIAAASSVAAGLINPVTGQRLVLQAGIEQLLPCAQSLYQSLERHFNTRLYFPCPIWRSFTKEREQQAWSKRQHDPKYTAYLQPHPLHADTLIQQRTAYVDTAQLCRNILNFFSNFGHLHQQRFQHQQCHDDAHGIVYQHIHAKRIIFCEGWRGMHNPYFKHLPFQPAQGEILDIQTDSPHPKHIVHQGTWLIPTHDGRLRLGASYNNKPPFHEQTTPQAATQLLQSLNTMPIQLEAVRIQKQQAGIRPNTRDKQPFIGFLPHHPRIGIFNGFGSKGSLLIPYYAQAMLMHMQQQTPIPKVADIQRFPCA